ncbi:hypothetical protein EVAR_33875_1 [Eumeta japonica]|uniref:Uncharacterized protein n=1 Tax=Eumeta variegata TaxID=151549 RepID=A0A4C1WLY5_EUMVA|nr:hypothetical protein EVAR_33875_1 [Eumeta japonica]
MYPYIPCTYGVHATVATSCNTPNSYGKVSHAKLRSQIRLFLRHSFQYEVDLDKEIELRCYKHEQLSRYRNPDCYSSTSARECHQRRARRTCHSFSVEQIPGKGNAKLAQIEARITKGIYGVSPARCAAPDLRGTPPD